MIAMYALGFIACDKLADEDTSGPPVAKMRGTLNLADGVDAPQGDLRLSILWTGNDDNQNRDSGGTCREGAAMGYRAETNLFEQRLDVTTDFPAAFSVELDQAPPQQALETIPAEYGAKPGTKSARGELIVYRDGNHNGRFDRHDLDERAPDQVLGAGWGTTPGGTSQPHRYQIQYVSDDLRPALATLGLTSKKAGYWLVRWTLEQIGGSWAWDPELLALDGKTKVELTLDATGYLQHWSCNEFCELKDPSACPTDPADLPPVQEIGKPVMGETASWFWEGDKDNRTQSVSAQCLRGARELPDGGTDAGWTGEAPGTVHEIYRVYLFSQEGCTSTAATCNYERGKLPDGADIPCSEFDDVTLPDDSE
jgi:hypothetical protein